MGVVRFVRKLGRGLVRFVRLLIELRVCLQFESELM
jgi:hypothetical protein